MSDKMMRAFRDAVVACVDSRPDAYTLLFSIRSEDDGRTLYNFTGGAGLLLKMATCLLAAAVSEATKSGNFALANRIDAALESLGDLSVISSTRVVTEDDL